MHGSDFGFFCVQFSNQAVKRILGDRVYAAYSLIFPSTSRKEEKHKKNITKIFLFQAELKKEPLRTLFEDGIARSLLVAIG